MNHLLIILGFVFCSSEIALGLFKRAKRDARTEDQGSLRLIWIVVLVCILVSTYLMARLPGASFELTPACSAAAIVLFVLGLGLRWYSVAYLGPYFTVNVSVGADHRIIQTGPYRYIRHPSYLGALIAFLGYSLCLHNYASIGILMAGVTWVFLRRIRIEEAVLLRAFGDSYRDYMRHTSRLIPALY